MNIIQATAISTTSLSSNELTAAQLHLVRLVRLERLTAADLVARKDPNEILVVVLQVLEVELLYAGRHTAHLHPHRFRDVTYGNVVALERCAAVRLGNAPLQRAGVVADEPDLQRTGGRRWNGCERERFIIIALIQRDRDAMRVW